MAFSKLIIRPEDSNIKIEFRGALQCIGKPKISDQKERQAIPVLENDIYLKRANVSNKLMMMMPKLTKVEMSHSGYYPLDRSVTKRILKMFI